MDLPFSKKTRLIKGSPTLNLNAAVSSLQKQGVQVANLSIGEPHWPMPTHIAEAMRQALKDGFTRYTPVSGIAELREAAANFFSLRAKNAQCPPEATIITNGAKQSLYNLFQALLNSGDEVLIPAPYWVSYPDMVFLAEGIPVIVPTTVQSKFKVSVEQLENSITPKTKILILNTPSNPTGVRYTKEELDSLFNWSINKGLFIIVDEIYSQLAFQPLTPNPTVDWWLAYPKRIALIDGLSKTYSMTGLRLGFTLTDPSIIQVLSQIQGQSTANVCSIVQKAAVAALTGPQNHLSQMVDELRLHRDLAWNAINAWPKTQRVKPEGAFYIFPDISAFLSEKNLTAEAFCSMLLKKLHIAILSGESFGYPGGIRISFATSKETLITALDRLSEIFS